MRPEPSSNISECSSPSSSSPSPSPSTPASASASASGKRSRDPEDEVYLDNFHSHKRYLSEIMASSLNGLTVGDPLPDNLMESPARSETMFYARQPSAFFLLTPCPNDAAQLNY
ncbi:hypothetical protein RchiOBHm_Chr7g0241891 [Rosa chinensis]|uniref:Uncharacterized protein n=1 Tax=Rosa chinensis TaxID=74649 RepID=A0A2P6PID3_ROSCH|nr:hypothetical protein RchiOBHm_Chr7g0241891 [Rosa chinensis]